eukprot:TRINITY_DN4259_c0_g1_i1.p1 TRINITY_DN4259_c0_g1~~TRINITY_DN4259_c0_g1_i1.p1  ORF type:complete len:105 (+),score=33.66 TRINITY_DN4259_c0_g1_i1:46-360(+)
MGSSASSSISSSSSTTSKPIANNKAINENTVTSASVETKTEPSPFIHLCMKEDFSDVIFLLHANTKEEKSVPAHRIVLSACSPAFRSFFYGSKRLHLSLTFSLY